MLIRDIVGLPGKSKQIIVAKYREKCLWLRCIKNIPVIIYDKNNKNAKHHLPNIPVFEARKFGGIGHKKTPTGRESHTYLYHIIKNYDSLPDMVVFLQGSPFEVHSNSLDALRVLVERDFEGVTFQPLNFPLVISNKKGAPTHRGLPIERVFKRLFKSECPSYFAYTWGAMFCASKEVIHRKPVAFYEEMMQVIYDEPVSGYVYERLWPTVLGCDKFEIHDSYSIKDRASWELPNL